MSLADRVALVTGANHGIGAATARALAATGAAVLLSYLRLEDQVDTATPERYWTARTAGAEVMVKAIEAAGGRALAVEADLTDPSTPSRLFDEAERTLGPVAILVNNASGWIADTFGAQTTDRFERRLRPVSVETFDRQFAVDA
ncbi:MAG: SDR family NAD(P)-dependent oxidoreductase, partial [Actinomycetota bacterium]